MFIVLLFSCRDDNDGRLDVVDRLGRSSLCVVAALKGHLGHDETTERRRVYAGIVFMDVNDTVFVAIEVPMNYGLAYTFCNELNRNKCAVDCDLLPWYPTRHSF